MDILPKDQKYWQFVTNLLENKAHKFGFSRIDTPLICTQEIIEKIPSLDPSISMDGLSRVVPKSAETELGNYLLRADGTANILNAYHTHFTGEELRPAKLYQISVGYTNPVLLPTHFFNAELIGDENPTSDALLILFAWQILKNLKLDQSYNIQLNSVGCPNCHSKITKQLENHYNDNSDSICPDCQKLDKKDIFKSLYCQRPECIEVKNNSPHIVDLLCEDCQNHLKQLFEYLDELQIPYSLDTHLFRNNSCATKTVFDIVSPENSHMIGRGSRHDNVIEKFGSIPVPAAGFHLMIDPIVQIMKNREEKISDKNFDIYVIQLGNHARKKVLPITNRLINEGFSVSCALHKDSLKNHLIDAEQHGAKVALIIGQREAIDNSVIFRDIRESSQETIGMDELEKFIQRKFSN